MFVFCRVKKSDRPKLQVKFPITPRRNSEKVVDSGDDYVITENEDKSDDDDVMIVEVEPKKRKVNEEVDVKPNVDRLDAAMNKKPKKEPTSTPPPATTPQLVVIQPVNSQTTTSAPSTVTSTPATAQPIVVAPKATKNEPSGNDKVNETRANAKDASSNDKPEGQSAGDKDKAIGDAADQKPDVSSLPEPMEVTQSEATSSQEPAENDAGNSDSATDGRKEGSAPTEDGDVQVASASSSSDPAPPASAAAAAPSNKEFKSAEVQTDDALDTSTQPSCSCQQEVAQLEETISSLRANVYKLLNVFVPELALDDINLIDTVVVEMIRVNSTTGRNDRTESAPVSADDSESVPMTEISEPTSELPEPTSELPEPTSELPDK